MGLRQSDQMWQFLARFWLFLGSNSNNVLVLFNIFWSYFYIQTRFGAISQFTSGHSGLRVRVELMDQMAFLVRVEKEEKLEIQV